MRSCSTIELECRASWALGEFIYIAMREPYPGQYIDCRIAEDHHVSALMAIKTIASQRFVRWLQWRLH